MDQLSSQSLAISPSEQVPSETTTIDIKYAVSEM